MEYYLAIKNNEIISFAGKWLLPEVMLNEVSQAQKDKYRMWSLLCGRSESELGMWYAVMKIP